MNKVEKEYDDYWKGLVENEDGTLNKEQIMKELYDYSTFMDTASKVYCHITGSKLSKVHYLPEVIISAAEEHQNDIISECIKEKMENLIDEIKDRIQSLTRRCEETAKIAGTNCVGYGYDAGAIEELKDLLLYIVEE